MTKIIKPKFNVGEFVWVLVDPCEYIDFYHPQIAYTKIVGISWGDDIIFYHLPLNKPWPKIIKEEYVFQTKEGVVEKYNSYFDPKDQIQI